MTDDTTRPTRAFDHSIEIDAPPDRVWQALTDPDEVVRWFPPVARVTPGVGGNVFWGWQDPWFFDSAILT
jgi:uncharacterized protein YndB with AHSA1/START domain